MSSPTTASFAMTAAEADRPTHFIDSFGPVCQAFGDEPLTSHDYRDVTCDRCRTSAPFISALPEHLKPRSGRRRLWPQSMQE